MKREEEEGRPPKYSDEFILTLFFLKTAREFSYRGKAQSHGKLTWFFNRRHIRRHKKRIYLL